MKYFWTVTGHRGETCTIMAHATEADAIYHHDLAKTLGGDFNTIGRTLCRMTQAKFVALLGDRFTGYSLAVIGRVVAA